MDTLDELQAERDRLEDRLDQLRQFGYCLDETKAALSAVSEKINAIEKSGAADSSLSAELAKRGHYGMADKAKKLEQRVRELAVSLATRDNQLRALEQSCAHDREVIKLVIDSVNRAEMAITVATIKSKLLKLGVS